MVAERWQLSSGLAWLAVPLLALGLGAAAPGSVAAAHLFIGALALAVLACGLIAVTERHLSSGATIVTLSAIGGLIAAVRMWHPVSAQRLGMCTMIGLLLLLTIADDRTVGGAIRPPHFGSITGRDVFRRNDGMPVDAVAPVDDEIDGDTSTPRLVAGRSPRRRGAPTGC